MSPSRLFLVSLAALVPATLPGGLGLPPQSLALLLAGLGLIGLNGRTVRR